MKLPYYIKALVLLFALLSGGFLIAENINTTQIPVQLVIPSKACINLAGTEVDTLNTKRTEQILTPTSDNKVWINYSSVVEKNTTNSICASLSSGDLPPEIIVKLHISDDAGAGSGQMGNPTEPIALTDYPQAIITNIGSCYTGEGPGKGRLISYTWELAPGAKSEDIDIEEMNIEIRVIFTIEINE
jgi:hypothetical protein